MGIATFWVKSEYRQKVVPKRGHILNGIRLLAEERHTDCSLLNCTPFLSTSIISYLSNKWGAVHSGLSAFWDHKGSFTSTGGAASFSYTLIYR